MPSSVHSQASSAADDRERPAEDQLLDVQAAQRGVVHQPGTNIISQAYRSIYLHEPAICEMVCHCNTGAPARKCISHIFGRNKKCTRLVPPHVWVHSCRKHYQRARYRNAVEWAAIQCILVNNQVVRIQAWSDKNEVEGKSPILLGWKLTVRKREADRLKRKPDQDEPFDHRDKAMKNAIKAGRSIPSWLSEYFPEEEDEDYLWTTEEVMEMFNIIKDQVDAGNVTVIPDIECLPVFRTMEGDEVTPPPAEPKSARPKKKVKRAPKPKSSSGSGSSGHHSRTSSSRQSSNSDEIPLVQYQLGEVPTFTGGGLRNGHRRRTQAGNPFPGTANENFDFAPESVPNGRYNGYLGPLPPLPAPYNGLPRTAGIVPQHGYTGFNPNVPNPAPGPARPVHHRSMSEAVNPSNVGPQPQGSRREAVNSFNIGSQPQASRRMVRLPPLPTPTTNSYGGVPSGPNTGALPSLPAPTNNNFGGWSSARDFGEYEYGSEVQPAVNTNGLRNWSSASMDLGMGQDHLYSVPQPVASMNYSHSANTGGALGAAAKHTRHHSTPVIQHNGVGSAGSFQPQPFASSTSYRPPSTQGNVSLPIRSNPQGAATQQYYAPFANMSLPGTQHDQSNGQSNSQDPSSFPNNH